MERAITHIRRVALVRRGLGAAFALSLWAMSLSAVGCDAARSSTASSDAAAPADELDERRAEFYRERAAQLGAGRARWVRLVAEDMAKLDPRSTRSEASRRAQELLDDVVPRETK